jgi:hypothetical protein
METLPSTVTIIETTLITAFKDEYHLKIISLYCHYNILRSQQAFKYLIRKIPLFPQLSASHSG